MRVTCGPRNAALALRGAAASSSNPARATRAGTGPCRSPQAAQHCWNWRPPTQKRRQKIEGGQLASSQAPPKEPKRTRARRPRPHAPTHPRATRGRPDRRAAGTSAVDGRRTGQQLQCGIPAPAPASVAERYARRCVAGGCWAPTDGPMLHRACGEPRLPHQRHQTLWSAVAAAWSWARRDRVDAPSRRPACRWREAAAA